MNALITIDSILEPVNALTPAVLFGGGQIEAIVSSIENHVRAEAFDITTDEGRERIKSVAYKIARSKTTLDEIGKEHVAAIKLQSAAIDKERKTLRDRLDALKDEVRGPLTAWEAAEEKRISDHERLIVEIIESTRFAATVPSSNLIEQRISSIRDICNRDWQEFHERAEAAATEALAALEPMLATAEQHERDAAELEALRKEKAEREAKDAHERYERELATIRQEKAEREARERAEQEERLAKWKADQEAAAKRQAEEAAARAVEQERLRAAREKAEQEIADRKRIADITHRANIHRAIFDALIAEGMQAETARAVFQAIADGRVPHVSINY